MRFISLSRTSWYVVQRVWPHKSLETGFQIGEHSDLDMFLSFTTKGDHAGLRFHFQVGRFLFEFNVCDDRHWNYDVGRFYRDGEEPTFEGYPHE